MTQIKVTQSKYASEELRIDRYRVASCRIPPAFDGFRIVAMADLHARSFGAHQQKLLEKVEAQKPQLILFSGDFLETDYEGEEIEPVDDLMAGLVQLAPVYAIFGNHETRVPHRKDLYQRLKALGVKVLLDQTVAIPAPGGASETILLTGFYTTYEHKDRDHVGLKYRYHQYGQKLRAEYREAMRLSGYGEDGPYRIALGHRPELFGLYHELKLDLVFSGHAHGGVYRFPGGRRLVAPDQGFFPGFTYGPYRDGRTLMLVTQGLGGPRLNVGQGFILAELRAKPDPGASAGPVSGKKPE